MAIGEKADVLLQELVEHAPLIIGDDPVADPRQRDGRAVGRKSLCREHRHRDQGDDHDHMEILVHIGFVDHRAEQIGGERRDAGGDGHQHEAEGVEPPVPQRLIDQQAAHQNAGGILVRGLAGLLGAVMRVPFRSAAAGLRADALERVSCPDGAEFSSEFKDIIDRKVHSREPAVEAQIAALRPAPAGRVWRVMSSRSQFKRVAHDGRKVVVARLPAELAAHPFGLRHNLRRIARPARRDVDLEIDSRRRA